MELNFPKYTTAFINVHRELRINKFFAIEMLAYGVKCCAVAKHVRLANGAANAGLKPVRSNTAVQAWGRSCSLHLLLAAVVDPAASQTEEG